MKIHRLGTKIGFVLVRCLKSGVYFDEPALINNDKKSLRIRVKSENCKLLKLDRETFTRILGSIE